MQMDKLTAWLRKNALWLVLQGMALGIFSTLLWQAGNFAEVDIFDLTFEESGKWAIRFLLLSLAMTPLQRVLNWHWVIPLRKPAGLWAFAFGLLHLTCYLQGKIAYFSPLDYLNDDQMRWGFFALLILTALASTSTAWAMRRLGKNWKRLHRLVYVAGVFVLLHALLAYNNTKRLHFKGIEASYEFRLYAVLLGVLLLLRLPFIRQPLKHWLGLDKTKRQNASEKPASKDMALPAK